MTKINMDELLADRAAGTDGPWQTTGVMFPGGHRGDVFKGTAKRIPDCHHIARCFAEKPEKSPACTLGAMAIEMQVSPIIEANARRIARLPDLEAAYIEAVGLLKQIADAKWDTMTEGCDVAAMAGRLARGVVYD